ncbi:MAG: universal stress protein [Saprospiraceae bacterium]
MNILCPIDFSNHSLYALDYAIDLANKLGGKIHLFTAYSVPKSTGRLRSLDGEIKKAVLEDLSEVLQSIEPKISTGIKPCYGVLEGNSGRVITEYAVSHQIDVIVMGTKGTGSISNIFLGSVAKKVVDNATIPVIAVPNPLKENTNQKYAILSLDEKEVKNDSSLRFLKSFIKKLEFTLDLFHVQTPGDTSTEYTNTIELLKDIVKGVKTESSSDITGSIKRYAEKSNCGLIIMIRRPHSFWSRLFMDTNTTTELAMTRIPIMILPE